MYCLRLLVVGVVGLVESVGRVVVWGLLYSFIEVGGIIDGVAQERTVL